jgi:hypothetical protein
VKTAVVLWREAVWKCRELDSTAKAVAFALSMHMDSNGSAYPSLATLAREAGLNERSHAADRAVRRLEQVRLLYVERSGGRNVHHYVALFPSSLVERSSTTSLSPRTTLRRPSNSAPGAHELEEQLEEQLERERTALVERSSEEHPSNNSKNKTRARAILDGDW